MNEMTSTLYAINGVAVLLLGLILLSTWLVRSRHIMVAGTVIILTLTGSIYAGLFMLPRMAHASYCQASGDFSDSDNFTVLSDFRGVNQGWLKGKDGKLYLFSVCPDSSVAWEKDSFVEEAHYEYRNGCASFNSKLAYFKLRR